jgi:hypothetical protein
VLNSDGDIRFIKPDGDCDSKEPESPEDAGLSRPVLLLSVEIDPLPLWLTSVVMEPETRRMRLPEWSAEAHEAIIARGQDQCRSNSLVICHFPFFIFHFDQAWWLFVTLRPSKGKMTNDQ